MISAEKLRLLADLAETGEEFEICGDVYRFVNGVLVYEEDGATTKSTLTTNYISASVVTRLPFKPKHGEEYYFIYAPYEAGYRCTTNQSTKGDRLIFSRETVYRTEAEAIAEVERRGWKV
jgi:hypothetical protein